MRYSQSIASPISHRFGLDEVDRAFTALEAKPANVLKAVIIP